MAAATIIEKDKGTDYVSTSIYGAWWFSVLWACLLATAIAYIIKRKMRRASTICLHLSLAIILLGAFATHVSGEQGMMHLRKGMETSTYYVNNGSKGVIEKHLPYSIRLNKFDVDYHDGTMAVADYKSEFTIIDGEKSIDGTVSMNNIYSYKSTRFYQSSFDEDMYGSILSLNKDPYGIKITYTGYAMLFISLIWMLFDPKGTYRKILRSDTLKRASLSILALFAFAFNGNAAHVLPQNTAKKFGELYILYNNRICPLQTFAIDFTKKIYGSSSYNGYSAEQVLTGFIFWGDEWSAEPIMKLKSGALRDKMMLPQYVSVNTFFSNYGGGYTIGPYIREYYQGNHDAFHKQVADVDDRLQLIMQLRQGLLLKIFPHTHDGATTWYSPTERIDSAAIENDKRLFIQNVFSIVYQDIQYEQYDQVDQILDKIAKYQLQNAGSSIPSANQTKAERLLNAVPFATILFMLNLTMGMLMLILAIMRLTSSRDESTKATKAINLISIIIMAASFAALSLCLALRWMVSGNIPMSNGYETMLLVAWLIMLCSQIMCQRIKIVTAFGFIMSGFALLVSHISQMSPAISHLMPVLNSPLLSLHVSVIMISFALLSLTFICGLMAMLLMIISKIKTKDVSLQLESLQTLSQIFLYPAMTTLGMGIFIGAIWANVSWGAYWSWDSKEVWALIVFMVYAILLHDKSLPVLHRPKYYHLFTVFAFLTVLMTYFGVNYILTGMHSYA